jgi:hypothetical protein
MEGLPCFVISDSWLGMALFIVIVDKESSTLIHSIHFESTMNFKCSLMTFAIALNPVALYDCPLHFRCIEELFHIILDTQMNASRLCVLCAFQYSFVY